MNIKEKLIAELKKGDWHINLYKNTDRLIGLLRVLNETESYIATWGEDDLIKDYLKLGTIESIYCNEYEELYEDDTGDGSDLTPLFNEYLEKYEPDIWMHSVLSAKQLGINVEFFSESAKWIQSREDVIFTSNKYRIKYKEPIKEKLVPDEIWDILDEEIVAIAKNKIGFLTYHIETPEIDHNINDWFSTEGGVLPDHIKCLKNAKIHDVDWKESLCLRPDKKG